MVEASFGVGLVAGPSLGGVLYNYLEFSIPFWILGVLTLGFAGLSASVFQNSGTSLVNYERYILFRKY